MKNKINFKKLALVGLILASGSLIKDEGIQKSLVHEVDAVTRAAPIVKVYKNILGGKDVKAYENINRQYVDAVTRVAPNR